MDILRLAFMTLTAGQKDQMTNLVNLGSAESDLLAI